jgi:hypothetical protein
VVEHIRHELVNLARKSDPVDQVVQLREQDRANPPRPDIDPDALVLADTYRLPTDVWRKLCQRAAVSHLAASDYVHGKLVRLARHPTIDDSMWKLGEVQAGTQASKSTLMRFIRQCDTHVDSTSNTPRLPGNRAIVG